MKIAKFYEYGNASNVVLEDVEIPKPTKNFVLVEIYASSINSLDVRVLTANPAMLKGILGNPKPNYNALGSDFAGIVAEVGEDVTDFSVGDEVFGQLAIMQDGAFAEYALVPETQLEKKPGNVSFSDAAAIPMAGVTALQALRLLDVKNGSKVLLYGASGGVGTFAIQIAKAMGAHVTAVCSTRNVKTALDLNADQVIDYKKEDWFNNDNQYDAIFAVNGNNPLRQYLDSLNNDSKIIIMGNTEQVKEEKIKYKDELETRNIEVLEIYAKIVRDDYKILANYLSNGQVKPVIGAEFMLDQIQEGYEYFMNGKAIGKVIIKMK